MQLLTLGRSNLHVTPLCLGGNVFGWTADEDASFAVLDALVNAGLNFVDTADVYSAWVPGHRGGESETIIGKWLKRSGRRNDMVIATKVGMQMAPDRKGLSAAHITRSVEESLQRLQTDHIDLYFSHCDDETVPLEETLGAYQRLISAGKVRSIGRLELQCGAFEAGARGEAARAPCPATRCCKHTITSMREPATNPSSRDCCLTEQVGVVSFFALASGFLTGKYRTEADAAKSARGKGVSRPSSTSVVSGFWRPWMPSAAVLGARRPVVALAWQIARPGIAAPICQCNDRGTIE